MSLFEAYINRDRLRGPRVLREWQPDGCSPSSSLGWVAALLGAPFLAAFLFLPGYLR